MYGGPSPPATAWTSGLRLEVTWKAIQRAKGEAAENAGWIMVEVMGMTRENQLN